MRESSTPNTEDDFVALLEELRNGQRSVDDFLGALGFESRLRSYCYRYDFRCFEGSYGPEDLRQVSREKVRRAAPGLKTANTPNRHAFFGWVRTLVYHTFLDARRAYNKPQNNGLSRCYELDEITDIQTPDVAYERKELFKRFMTFIERYPESHRMAIGLWLEEASYRAIAKALSADGAGYSYGTVRLWVLDILEDFKAELRLRPPRKPRRRSG